MWRGFLLSKLGFALCGCTAWLIDVRKEVLGLGVTGFEHVSPIGWEGRSRQSEGWKAIICAAASSGGIGIEPGFIRTLVESVSYGFEKGRIAQKDTNTHHSYSTGTVGLSLAPALARRAAGSGVVLNRLKQAIASPMAHYGCVRVASQASPRGLLPGDDEHFVIDIAATHRREDVRRWSRLRLGPKTTAGLVRLPAAGAIKWHTARAGIPNRRALLQPPRNRNASRALTRSRSSSTARGSVRQIQVVQIEIVPRRAVLANGDRVSARQITSLKAAVMKGVFSCLCQPNDAPIGPRYLAGPISRGIGRAENTAEGGLP
jgi:hypothetical protein